MPMEAKPPLASCGFFVDMEGIENDDYRSES